MLSTIAEEEEDSDFATKSVDSAQEELDNISREPHEFTHSIPKPIKKLRICYPVGALL